MALSSFFAVPALARRFAPLALTGLAALSLFAAPQTARADVKLVTVADAGGLETKRIRILGGTIVRYFKGDKYRQEWAGRNIVRIYDGAKDRMYTLNRADQTYTVQTFDEAMNVDLPGSSGVKLSGRAIVRDSGNTRPIAGKGAKSYSVNMVALLNIPDKGVSVVVSKIEGEVWAAEKVPFPSQNRNIRRLSYAFVIGGGKLWEPYFEQVDQMQNLPLALNLQITAYLTKDRTPDNIDVHEEATTVSTAKIPDYMFQVPKSYKLVDKLNANLED